MLATPHFHLLFPHDLSVLGAMLKTVIAFRFLRVRFQERITTMGYKRIRIEGKINLRFRLEWIP